MKRLGRALRGVHRNALAFSHLVTLTPLAYPAMLPLASAYLGMMLVLDPKVLEDGGEFDDGASGASGGNGARS